jgi:hypothetical protein
MEKKSKSKHETDETNLRNRRNLRCDELKPQAGH